VKEPDEPEETEETEETEESDRTEERASRGAVSRRRKARPAEADERDDDRDEERPERRSRAGGAGIGAAEAAGRAAAQVRAMTGRSPEGVTAVERTEDGWRIGIEVVESRRIPDSTDILALYRVDLDRDGELLAYRRENRYHRGRTPDEEGES